MTFKKKKKKSLVRRMELVAVQTNKCFPTVVNYQSFNLFLLSLDMYVQVFQCQTKMGYENDK